MTGRGDDARAAGADCRETPTEIHRVPGDLRAAMLAEAFSFPRRDDDWLVTVLIGGVLTLLGFLVIPAILVNGYLLRVTRAAVRGEAEPPAFDDWGELLVDGVLVWVVELVYVGVPGLLLALIMGTFVVITAVTTSTTVGVAPRAATGIALVVGLALLAVLGTLLVVAAYLLPAALANFARTGDVLAAFHLGTVARAAFSVDYLVAVLLAIVVAVVLGTVGGFLSVILIGVFVLFYMQLVIYHLFGQGFARGHGPAEGTGDDRAASG